jgi:putative nucleotidyltransferase with HDIG domain
MSTSSTNRNRWIPAAPKAPHQLALEFMKRSDVWLRLGLCALVTVGLFVVMTGWNPPFKYRLREAPLRNLHAHTEFKFSDFRATEEEKNRVLRNFRCYYQNDRQLLDQLRNALTEDLFLIVQKEFSETNESGIWEKFYLPPPENTDNSPSTTEQADEESFDRFRKAIATDDELTKLREAVKKAFIDIDENGLLKALAHEIGEGNLQEIEIYDKGNFAGGTHVAAVSEVRIVEIVNNLKRKLIEEISVESEAITDPEFVAQRVYQWLRPRLPETLTWDETRTAKDAKEAAKAVKPIEKTVAPGDPLESDRRAIDSRVIRSRVPLNEQDIELLKAEHDAFVTSETLWTKLVRGLFFFGLNAAMFLLITQYLYFRDPDLLADIKQFCILLGLMFVALAGAWLLALNDEWRAEIIPIVMFSITIAIAYHIELALLLGALVSFAFSVAHGYGMAEFVVLTAASSTAALMCRQIRSRTKLVSIGLVAAILVFPTALGANYLLGQPLGWALTTNALWFAGGAAIAGLLMTGILPFLERIFDIQTDISLLELSDANHPLLKELVQRAPGTYNHSINVASMSEAAADAIGANGLLCRVGAYFHDAGKLRKPDYFIENQGGGQNKHDDLAPSMSTLVIIAHVKDGAEIAKKHRLPRRIIDLIEQHHGTTLVEYFYRRAEQQLQEKNAEGDEETALDEADFRYPGPKPQTPEAAVMMLADTVESASRTLRDPAPARIENLVKTIAKKKIDDGQFDECQITIEQLHTIEESLIKSLNAMYHARVKYPEKELAQST